MRDGSKGMNYIHFMMEKMGKKHKVHLDVYGEGNEKRLTGHHETSSMHKFSYGVGNRAASVRIPTSTANANGKGYIEDRRPASNIDPYLVTALIADTTLCSESVAQQMIDHLNQWREWKSTETFNFP
jgi:glutamine synthetase